VSNSQDEPADIIEVDSLGNLVGPPYFVDDSLIGSGLTPGDVTFGPGGAFGDDLYFTDLFCHCVRSADADGNVSSPFVVLPGPDIPRDLEFGPGGPFGSDLYVAVGGTIYRVYDDTTFTVFASGFGGLANDALEFSADATALYVADWGHRMVYRIGVPNLNCVGFEPPMAAYPGTVRGKNRALPLKAELLDRIGNLMTDADINTPPVLQVWFESSTGGALVEVIGEALPAGQGDVGNQFYFTNHGKWQFNLKTKDFTAAGTYYIYMMSGDTDECVISPQCETAFEVP
jgi:hypothetical protein